MAKISRASMTVTWYPSTLATLASAAVKSTAPKIHIRGGGENDSTNTRTVAVFSRSSGVDWPWGP